MRYLRIIIDVMLTLTVLPCLFARIIIAPVMGKRKGLPQRKLLVLDMAYTLEMIKKRQLHESITCRDLNGYFKHVWSVHPCATLISPENVEDTYGEVTETRLTEKHTIAEGKIGRYRALRNLPLLNFFLAQWNVYSYLNRLVKREKICVVRAGEPYYLSLWALAIARTYKIPCAIRVCINYDAFYKSTGHLAFPRLFRKRWVEKIIERFTLKRMDLVGGANQDNLKFAIANGARKEVSTVFRYGNLIHSAHFKDISERPSALPILQELGLQQKRFSITISRLEVLKHVDDVLRVIANVNENGFPLTGLLVGDGRIKEYLLEMAADLKISDKIIFAGNRDQEWLATILPHAVVVISPFMGRALTEAALSGVPIVAYDIDWQSEIIQAGITGELIPYRDWKSMAAAVMKYLKDPQYAIHMGVNVRKVALEMMDPVKLNQHERNEYDKLFARYFSK